MKKTYLVTIFFLLSQITFAQLTLRVNQVPANTPMNDVVYVAGNFQGWDAGDANYQLTEVGNGVWEIEISPAGGMLEFKFTRGSWSTVEGNASGGFIPNRTFNYSGDSTTLDLSILGWEDLGSVGNNSTAASNVQLLDDDFFMPELNRNRKIWIYLPPDYDTSQKDYPVLYMQDGQNVFDAATSFSGEWEVDESLNQLFDDGDYGVIVVAIANGGSHRVDEYSPWINSNYGGGEGDEYLEFIVNTLKPHVDTSFRTLSGREYTGLMGSSLGGLISTFGGIEHQEVFSKIGTFSPSYWFSNESFTHVTTTGKQHPMKIYTIIGELEGNTHVDNVNQMEDTFLDAGFTADELNTTIHNDGQHSEWYWAREFPAAYEWLFGDLDLTSINNTFTNSIQVFPNPTSDYLFIRGIENFENHSIEIYHSSGQLVSRAKLQNDQIDLQNLPKGFYYIKISNPTSILFLGKTTRIN
ncbi:MAG: alpha/beta hydrolase-fold protein [Saprospiraceae bacterium]